MSGKHLLVCLYLLSLNPVFAQENSHETNASTFYPSAELLEFLAEMGDVDDETYELAEYHALQDLSQQEGASNDE